MPDLSSFTADARAFVAAHHPVRDSQDGESEACFSVLPERTPEVEAVELAEHLSWRRTCFDAGYGWVDGPVEYGGAGLGPEYAAAYREVERQFAVPDEAYTRFSVSILCPTLLAHASEELREELLRALRRADLVACQLFSEPDAGSHMSATRTQARRAGDDWIINGQKVWSSGAHFSQVGLLLARTTPGSTGSGGLTTFLIDMDQPGVEVRPIRQLSGGASFSEVFLTNAQVSDARRVGEVGHGWGVIAATMLHERAAIGTEGGVDAHLAGQLVALAKATDRWDDPAVREAVGEASARARATQLLTQRYCRVGASNGGPGPEMALSKVLLTDNLQRISSIAQDLLGEGFASEGDEPQLYAWHQLALTLPGLRIGGGTDEILRDIVAHRVLRLPR